ncbi:MAG: hypothetical protein HY235_00040 [Acidobacteria bacterium]|nr:hypothetical protein [Acidobacteriota bacterium]
MNHNRKQHVTRRGLILAGGAALVGTRLHAAPDKDPGLIVLLDFAQRAGAERFLEADLEIRRGFTEASGNVDFSVRISGLVITDQGAWAVSPKVDPIALLKTKSTTPTPNGSTEVRTQSTNQYKGPGGTFSVLLRAELLNPKGVIIAASELTKSPVTFPPLLA